MNNNIFIYLKKNNFTDIELINKLIISAFLRHYDLKPCKNSYLLSHLIDTESTLNSQLEQFIVVLNENLCDYSIDDMITLFEFVVSPKDKIISGTVYTPKYLRERIVNESLNRFNIFSLSKLRYADICCGCGGFLVTIALFLHSRFKLSFEQIFRCNLFGIDIQEYSILRTKLVLSFIALLIGKEDHNFSFNLFVGDSLIFDFNKIAPLDVIVGNPPYVCSRKMTKTTRERLSNWSVVNSGNCDLYIPFFQIAIENLSYDGFLGFITMNSFLTSLNGRLLRAYLQDIKFDIEIVDFRGSQMFLRKSTYTCFFFLKKNRSHFLKYCVNYNKIFPKKFSYKKFLYDLLDPLDGWILNSIYNPKKDNFISLSKFCDTRHGIATLCNGIYVFKPIKTTKKYYYFIKNNEEFKIEKDICRNIVNSNKLNSSSDLLDICEKIIYPYYLKKDKICVIPEEILIFQYPCAYKYLLTMRNVLFTREKGKGSEYAVWYAYGRSQSLSLPKYKLFFPKIANKPINCILSNDTDLLLYNGMAFVSNDAILIHLVKKIVESSIFWKFIICNAKPYRSGYYSLSGASIKNFYIPAFTSQQRNNLLSLSSKEEIDDWLMRFYSS